MTIRVRALGEEEAAELGGMARSRTLGAGLVRRAQIIQHAVGGLSAPEIAARMGLCGATVRFWLNSPLLKWQFDQAGSSETTINRMAKPSPDAATRMIAAASSV
jgi:DNA-binding NarL/FixJ family response regulator